MRRIFPVLAGNRMGRVRRIFPVLAILSGLGLGAAGGSAQDRTGGWVFTSLPLADLWFHGMALVDPIGPGPNPLYDPGYPSEVARARGVAGVSSTVLGDRLGYFRGAFRGDPAFEVLHFLPLYFPQAGRTEVFAALELLADTEEGIPRGLPSRTSFGVAAIGSVLATPGQRQVLGEFVQALGEEWDRFYGPWWRGLAATRDEMLAGLQESWRSGYGAALRPFLEGVGMSGGVVALVPALGNEGRVFGGSPRVSGDNVVVVSAPAGREDAREAVFFMIRELSFPMVRRTVDRLGALSGDREEDEGLAARAAVRSGALILGAYYPEDVTEYQKFFLTRAGRSLPSLTGLEAAFEEVYPLSAGLEEALREEVLSNRRDGGIE